jgi:hypothetical protein
MARARPPFPPPKISQVEGHITRSHGCTALRTVVPS